MKTDTGLRVSLGELMKLLPEENPEDVEQVFSFLAWSVMCEPGDGFAGMMVSALGAKGALSSEINLEPAGLIKSKMLAAGISEDALSHYENFEKSHQHARERWRPRLSMGEVTSAIRNIQKLHGFALTPASTIWPKGLEPLGNNTPMALWVRGSVDALAGLENSVAVVGGRGATSYGEVATKSLVTALIEKDISVVSGGAYGIDAAAHRSALAMNGNTVAIMAGGVDRLYPSGNFDLLNKIIATGAVISELPPGSSPTRWRFLQRNRLISALSQATVVVEAKWRSGALNTVSHSERLNKEVYAVPGPITSPMSAGTNKLIADERATLVIDSKDLLERLGVDSRAITQAELVGLGAIETRVLDAIGFDEVEIAQICLDAGLTRDEARFGLGILEIDGHIVRRGNAWARGQTKV